MATSLSLLGLPHIWNGFDRRLCLEGLTFFGNLAFLAINGSPRSGKVQEKRNRLAWLQVNKYREHYINQKLKKTLRLAYFSHMEGQENPSDKFYTAK